MTAPDENPAVIEVRTRRIDGVIPLSDLAARLRQGPVRSEAATDPETAERLNRISDLAGRLADELDNLPRT